MALALYEEWLTDEGLAKIRGWVAEGLTAEQIATDKIYIGYATLKKWRKQFKELDDILPKRKTKAYQTDGSQAKAYLNRFKNRWVEKAEKMERLNDARVELLDKATRTTNRLNPVRVQTSHRNDKIERSVIDAESLAERIRATAARIEQEKTMINKQIQKVAIQPEHDLLVNVILQEKPLYRVAKEMRITKDSGKYHLNKAFQEFEKVNPELFEGQKETN